MPAGGGRSLSQWDTEKSSGLLRFEFFFFFLFLPEFTMMVKETYCSVTNLEPNTQYEFWVIAQNRTGPSPCSEHAVYMTGTDWVVNFLSRGHRHCRILGGTGFSASSEG